MLDEWLLGLGLTESQQDEQLGCVTCPIKAQCCQNTPACKITRSLYEPARDAARQRQDRGIPTITQEQKKVEMLFAHLKRILKLDRLRLRGLSYAQMNFYWRQLSRIYDGWRAI